MTPASKTKPLSTTTTGYYRWLVVVLLFTATTINYLDRQIIGLLKPLLELEFSWSETDFANIVIAFMAAYSWLTGRWLVCG